MNREQITEQLVALATAAPSGLYAEGVRDLARLLVDGATTPKLADRIQSTQGNPWAEVLPEGTTMRPGMQMVDDNTTNASDTRNSGDEFQAEWIAAELERVSRR